MKVNQSKSSNFKLVLQNAKFEKNFSFQREFWALVKKNFQNFSILSVGEKEFSVKNLAHLIEGERLLLSPKILRDKIELEILERTWNDTNLVELKNIFSKTSFSLEKFLENSISEESSNFNQILSILKTFFPFIDWSWDTPYYSWESEKERGEAFFSKQNAKLILKIFRPILGNIEVMIQYSLPLAEEIDVFTKVERLEVYQFILEHLNTLKKYFIDEKIQLNKFTLQLQTVSSNSKGWQV